MNDQGALAGAELPSLPESGLLVVGFSGGADSTALAHWLLQAFGKERLVLAHVNHLLRGDEAERDEAAAKALAEAFGVRFALLRADVKALAAQRGLGLEECGRAVRYEFLESLAPGENDRIFTAHNAEDNAETILLNLCRGAGLAGLCGVPPARGKILRPFLGVAREAIEDYCAYWGLPYVTDSSNLSADYSRNRIRREVMPVLRELNPRFVQAAAQTARLLRRDREFLRAQAEELMRRAQGPWGLKAAELLRAPESPGALALKLFLEGKGCRDLEKKHLDAAWRLLEAGGSVSLPGGVCAGCSQGVFWAERPQKDVPFSLPVSLGETRLPNGKALFLEKKSVPGGGIGPKIHNSFFLYALDYDIITGNLVARSRKAGDRFSPAGRHVTKTLKQLFQEQGVPPARRGRAVLLECGGELAFCEGVGASQRFSPTENTKMLLTVRVEELGGKDG